MAVSMFVSGSVSKNNLSLSRACSLSHTHAHHTYILIKHTGTNRRRIRVHWISWHVARGYKRPKGRGNPDCGSSENNAWAAIEVERYKEASKSDASTCTVKLQNVAKYCNTLQHTAARGRRREMEGAMRLQALHHGQVT